MRLVTLSTTPPGEPRAHPDWGDYRLISTLESRAFRDFLLRKVGQEPGGCHLSIRQGRLVLVVTEEGDEVEDYIGAINNCPSLWDDRSLGHLIRGLLRSDFIGDWDLEPGEFRARVHRWYEEYELQHEHNTQQAN